MINSRLNKRELNLDNDETCHIWKSQLKIPKYWSNNSGLNSPNV